MLSVVIFALTREKNNDLNNFTFFLTDVLYFPQLCKYTCDNLQMTLTKY